jgi:chorismate synthase
LRPGDPGWDWEETDRNPFFCPDAATAAAWATYLDEDVRKQGDSVGALVEVVATGVPAGWGAPLYGKLDADLAAALMSINAVKGVEIGAGMTAAAMRGSEAADTMHRTESGIGFGSNNNGGVLAGISSGQDIHVRFAVKPTSSILTPVKSLDRDLNPVDVVTKGRHDPCVGIRAAPVGEAMVACVLADHFLRHRAQIGPAAS